MHGVVKEKKTEAQLKEAQREAAEKISLFKRVSQAILQNHADKAYSETALIESAKMCGVNPDFYSTWNYRRLNLEALWTDTPTHPLSAAESLAIKTRLCKGELDVTMNALGKNPKSYCAWHHRVWVVLRGTVDLNYELAICTKYLKLDARNFHVWNYRRFVVAQCEKRNSDALAAATVTASAATATATAAPAAADAKSAPAAPAAAPAVAAAKVVVPFPELLQRELSFTSDKINENFSNYSAWHYRSVLIPKIVRTTHMTDAAIEALLTKELELVRNAFFTEPTDQSSWLYHRWLLGKIVGRVSLSSLGGVSIGISAQQFGAAATAAPAATAATASGPSSGGSGSGDAAAAAALAPSQSFPDDHLITLSPTQQLVILQRETDSLRELAEVEPNCKWVWLTIAILMGSIEDCRAAEAAAVATAAGKPIPTPSAADTESKTKAVSDIFTRLIDLDPMRTNYYESVRRRLMQQIQRK